MHVLYVNAETTALLELESLANGVTGALVGDAVVTAVVINQIDGTVVGNYTLAPAAESGDYRATIPAGTLAEKGQYEAVVTATSGDTKRTWSAQIRVIRS